jgi:hypothetical protein
MPSLSSKTLLSALAGAASVAAHGHVNNIVINGLSYQAYDPTVFPYMASPPVVAGWTSGNTDNGFVAPDAFASGDIICHKDATNAKGHAVVAAGDKVFIQWNSWPESHKGPVLDYLANCGSSGCETVDKTALEFFKIDEVGLIDGSSAPGKWGSDQLIANNNSWMVQIPANIAPGFYVLRHEIIALHSAGQENGAQNYPVCFNLQVTGSGTESPAGVSGQSLYTPTDPGILVNIYQSLSSYTIPGPALIDGASSIAQGTSAITASATAITGSATAAPAQTTASSAVATSATATSAAATSPVSSSVVGVSSSAPVTTAAPVASATTSAASSPTGCPGAAKRRARRAARRAARRHARDLGLN